MLGARLCKFSVANIDFPLLEIAAADLGAGSGSTDSGACGLTSPEKEAGLIACLCCGIFFCASAFKQNRREPQI